MIRLVFIGLLLALNLHQSEANVGVCYKPGKNQPPPAEAIALMEKHKIDRVRLYGPNKEALTALKGKNIEVMLGVPNADVIPLSTNPALAEAWVRTNVKAYLPDVKIKYIIVGNEISRNNNNAGESFFLIDTLQNFQKAVSKEGLKDIKVTSAFDTSILIKPYESPPSNVSLVAESLIFLDPILKFFKTNGSPFMVNIYTYYAHIMNQQGVILDSALLKATNGNVFDGLLEAMNSALEKAGHKGFEIVVAETGWPTAGGLAASVENQQTYITNLLQHLNTSAPMKPTNTFLYVMFDDDVTGVHVPAVEKHWGLFTPKKELKFKFTGAFN